MIIKTIKLGLLISALGLGACQQQTELYNWGEYETTMLAYYKDASHIDAFEAELLALIEQSDVSGKKIGPGIFAEYGYLLLQKGDIEKSVKFFALEKKRWPESKLLMDTMIKAASGQPIQEKKDESKLNVS